MKFQARAFTLMEMLLVTALIAAVSIAVFSLLKNGLKLWARCITVDHKRELFIGMERMAKDLRGTLPFSMIKFRGSGEKISFAAIILTQADGQSSRAAEGLIDQIGAVEYRYDPSQGKIFRRQADYGQALKKQWGEEVAVAREVSAMRFDYYISGERKLERRGEVETSIPAGVMMNISLRGGQQQLQRYFDIPVGGQ